MGGTGRERGQGKSQRKLLDEDLATKKTWEPEFFSGDRCKRGQWLTLTTAYDAIHENKKN